MCSVAKGKVHGRSGAILFLRSEPLPVKLNEDEGRPCGLVDSVGTVKHKAPGRGPPRLVPKLADAFMARGPLCSFPEPTHTLDHRADPLGTGARCAAMHSYTRVSARRCFFSTSW